MDQYAPAGKVSESTHPEINRKLTSTEFREAQHIASDPDCGVWTSAGRTRACGEGCC